MNLNEAIAVYLYLQNANRENLSMRNKKAFSEAWGMICHQAERVIGFDPRDENN
jgi:hypothetical protein